MKKKILAATMLAATLSNAQILTQQNILQGVNLIDPNSVPLDEIVLDRIQFDDNIYSSSKKTELGDKSELAMALRYHVSPTTFTRFRFVTTPGENRYNNKTSRFELVFAKTFNNVNIQIDLDLLTNDVEDDADSGGSSIGPDIDSDDTFIAFNMGPKHSLIFYPFNFRSDVGDEFNTVDVTRINSVENSPTSIGATPTNSAYIVSKTIPGLEYNYHNNGHIAYAGVGVASYFFPTNGSFDIETNASATAWERKQTVGLKFGYLFLDGEDTKVNFQFVTHDKTDETGGLLETAASLNMFKRFKKFIFEVEGTMTKAGEKPYQIDQTTRWFRNVTPFLPVYVDVNGDRHDWIGETGYGVSFKAGVNIGKTTPFISLKYQDENFIFDGIESAHMLRTKDEDKSHGGLTRIGLGAYFYQDNMYFRPMLEYQMAENAVFTNSTDQRNDRSNSSFKKENLQLSFNLIYTFDNFSSNQLWWF